MRIVASSILCALTLCKSASAQNNHDGLEHWRRSTVAIGEVLDGRFVTIGSGLLITVDGKTACILTAKHVFLDQSKGWTPTSIRIPHESPHFDGLIFA
jgi:hypothetical protein